MFGMEWTGEEPEDVRPMTVARDRQPAATSSGYRTAVAIACVLVAAWALHAHLPHTIPLHGIV